MMIQSFYYKYYIIIGCFFPHSVANLYACPRINSAAEALLKLHILWKEIKGVGDTNKNGLKYVYSFNYLPHERSAVAFGSSVPPIVTKRASVFENFLFLSTGKQSVLLYFQDNESLFSFLLSCHFQHPKYKWATEKLTF